MISCVTYIHTPPIHWSAIPKHASLPPLPPIAVITFLLGGIENIGVQLEEPFRALPLHRFSVGCKNSVLSMMRERHDAAAMAQASEAMAAQQLGQGLKCVEPEACTAEPQAQAMRRDFSLSLLSVQGQ